jgi:tetratricopeptide (TPR) repeat protein
MSVGLLASCGGGASDRAAMLERVEAGDWPGIRAEAALLRQAGVVEPWLDYADGLAALHEGAEQNARRLLGAAVAADPSFAAGVARAWAELALEDRDAGWRDRARERMAEAVLTDPSTDPGPLLPAVADYIYRHLKNYDAAFPLYERLYRERPEPVARHSEWIYRWGHSLELKGDLEGALAIYNEFLELFPDDMKQGRYVHWRYMAVLMAQAEQARGRGDLDEAVELLEGARLGDWHLDQQSRVEFMAGQIREQQGELELARKHYELVVRHGEKRTSEVVDDARARLDALDELGVH